MGEKKNRSEAVMHSSNILTKAYLKLERIFKGERLIARTAVRDGMDEYDPIGDFYAYLNGALPSYPKDMEPVFTTLVVGEDIPEFEIYQMDFNLYGEDYTTFGRNYVQMFYMAGLIINKSDEDRVHDPKCTCYDRTCCYCDEAITELVSMKWNKNLCIVKRRNCYCNAH